MGRRMEPPRGPGIPPPRTGSRQGPRRPGRRQRPGRHRDHRRSRRPPGWKAAAAPGPDACVRYLASKREFLRYGQALDAGWPIATGVIEGACRHLIADRLNLGGARWGLNGAEAILTLRAVISNGDFEEYWRLCRRRHKRHYADVLVMLMSRGLWNVQHAYGVFRTPDVGIIRVLRGTREARQEAGNGGPCLGRGVRASARSLRVKVGVQVDPGGFGLLVAEPEGDDGQVGACMPGGAWRRCAAGRGG